MKPQDTKRKPVKGPEVNPAPVKRRERKVAAPRRISLSPDEGRQQPAE